VTRSGSLFQRVRRENAAALDTGKEPTAGDLFVKGLCPGFNGLRVFNTSGPLELLHVIRAPTAADAKGVLVPVEKQQTRCERDSEQRVWQFGSCSLVKSALGALRLRLILRLPSVKRTAPTDGAAQALAQLGKESVTVRALWRLGGPKKMADNAPEIGTLMYLVVRVEEGVLEKGQGKGIGLVRVRVHGNEDSGGSHCELSQGLLVLLSATIDVSGR
jgi:hypothetical protein